MSMGAIRFRPLAEDDFPLLHRWLNTDTVMEWYGKKPVTLEEVAEKYKKYITARSLRDHSFSLLMEPTPDIFKLIALLIIRNTTGT